MYDPKLLYRGLKVDDLQGVHCAIKVFSDLEIFLFIATVVKDIYIFF